MYEYIKGKKIQSEEHMLSATELAKAYGFYKSNGEPNPIVVRAILDDYNRNKNLNLSEFYYQHSHGCMRVYPEILWRTALSDFIYHNELYKHSGEQLYYKMTTETKTYSYYYNEPKKVIDFKKRGKLNGS